MNFNVNKAKKKKNAIILDIRIKIATSHPFSEHRQEQQETPTTSQHFTSAYF